MMGVVLWSDPYDQKAVFWCEDHGDLAYYDASMVAAEGQNMLGAGDMVEFDLSVERKTRRAHNARVVTQRMCNGLPDDLRKTAASAQSVPNPTRTTGEVVRLHANTDRSEPERKLRNG